MMCCKISWLSQFRIWNVTLSTYASHMSAGFIMTPRYVQGEKVVCRANTSSRCTLDDVDAVLHKMSFNAFYHSSLELTNYQMAILVGALTNVKSYHNKYNDMFLFFNQAKTYASPACLKLDCIECENNTFSEISNCVTTSVYNVCKTTVMDWMMLIY